MLAAHFTTNLVLHIIRKIFCLPPNKLYIISENSLSNVKNSHISLMKEWIETFIFKPRIQGGGGGCKNQSLNMDVLFLFVAEHHVRRNFTFENDIKKNAYLQSILAARSCSFKK